MKKGYWIGFSFVILFIAAAIYTGGGKIKWFIDFPSLLMVSIPTLVLGIGTLGTKVWKNIFILGIGDAAGAAVADLKAALVGIRALGRYAYIMALIGTVTGLMSMVGNLEDLHSVAEGISLAILTLYYATLFYILIVLPIRHSLEVKIAEAGKS